MGNWNDIHDELKAAGSVYDVIRRKYLQDLFRITNRNIIIYYSGWLQKPEVPGVQVNDADKNGLMTVVNRMDRSLGLDLLLHTPGGEVGATESLVDYLRSMFGSNIRAIIPQLAMSAGTMIACACKQVVMGKQSSLGPIDPQYGNFPAHGVVEEFNKARKEIKTNKDTIPLWQPIIARYPPTFIGECEKAIKWSNELVAEWLATGMFDSRKEPEKMAQRIVRALGDHALMKSHDRHLSAKKCRDIGLRVAMLEKNRQLQNAVLSVHHACIHTLSTTNAFKIIENHNGVAFIQAIRHMPVAMHAAQQKALQPKMRVQNGRQEAETEKEA